MNTRTTARGRRLPGPQTTATGGGGVVAVNPGAATLDPGLEKLCHFTLDIGDSVLMGTRGSYNKRSHTYKDSFVNPATYRFWLSARDGLSAFRSRTVARIRARPKAGSRLAGWLDDRDHPRAPIEPGMGIPDWLDAYVWTVNQVGGKFSKREIVRRPLAPMDLATIDVPEVGTYDIQLRVVTTDNRYFERTMRVTFRAWFFASIGDSSASGEGNPMIDGDSDNHSLLGWPYCQAATLSMLLNTVTNKLGFKISVSMSDQPEWLEKRAHRSLTSGPAIAARALENRTARTLKGRIHSLDVITFVTVARSGACIRAGLLQPQSANGDFVGVGQVEELKRAANGRLLDVLMINIGGNDAGFSTVLSDMVAEDSVLKPSLKEAVLMALLGLPIGGDDASERKKIRDRLSKRLDPGGDVEQAFDELRGKVNELVAPGTGQVYITGYPIWLFDILEKGGTFGFKADGIFEGPDMDVTNADYTVILEQGRKLNELIKRKAGEQDFGWIYVEPSQEFRGRGYSSDHPLWHGATHSCDTQGDFDGTMHPTPEGHGEWAMQYVAAIRSNSMI